MFPCEFWCISKNTFCYIKPLDDCFYLSPGPSKVNVLHKFNLHFMFSQYCSVRKSHCPNIPIFVYTIIVLYTEAVVRRCSVKKVFLEMSQNSQENTCARVAFLILLQAEVCNFIKKETLAEVFSVNFVKFLRILFLIEHLWWLLLYIKFYFLVYSDVSRFFGRTWFLIVISAKIFWWLMWCKWNFPLKFASGLLTSDTYH